MDEMRKSIERKFDQMARVIYKHRIKTIIVMLLFFAGFASNLPKITIDTSTEGFLHESDPKLIDYRDFRDRFGREEMVIIAINPEQVFDLGFLTKLKSLHDELESTVPYLDDINSLVNARNTRGEADELIVEDLMEDFPDNKEDIALLRERVLSNPIYKNFLISEDGKFTTVMIKTSSYADGDESVDELGGFEDEETTKPVGETPKVYLTDQQNTEVVEAVFSVVEKYEADDFPISVAGSPVVVAELKRSMMRDMRKFMVMAIVIVGAMLFVMFRRVSGVIFPFIIIIATLFSTIGLMAATGASIKLPTQILPSFLLAVGVGASVHILALFYYRLHHGDNKEDAIAYSMGHSGLAVVMTSLTTAAGLGSFSTAQVAPIADLGIYASSGVLISLAYTMILLPALIAIVPIKANTHHDQKKKTQFLDRLLVSIADFSSGHPKKILAVSAVIIVIAGGFASTVVFSHNVLKWMPPDFDIRKTTELVDKNLKGSTTLEVIVDTGKENGLYDPSVLNKLESLGKEMEQIKDGPLFVGKTASIVDIVKEINRALNENRIEEYKVPQDRELIAQELLLFENSGSDDLEDFTDSQFSQSRVTIKAPWLDAIMYGGFADMVEKRYTETLGDDAKVTVTGMVALLGRTISAAIFSAALSYAIAGVVITFMMILLIGRVKTGILSMIPNLLPILLAIGVMGAFSWPMDMFTMLIGSIAIGLAVDDTIHFMHNFHRYFHETKDAAESVRRTLLTTGRAMLATTVVLSSGFFIYLFSYMENIFRFGLLTGFAILMALVADFFLAPAMMTLIARRRASDI